MKANALIWILFLCAGKLMGQISDIAALYKPASESVSYLLFGKAADGFTVQDAFTARSIDLAQDYPRLLVSGDFTGEGADELAVFSDLEYSPNLNPAFTCSVVSVSRSAGEEFEPVGTWFSCLKTELDFDHVSFSVAGDYNLDGFCDIAIFYNDPARDQLNIYVLESNGSGFSEPKSWYTVDRNEFNFTALKFACGGDFNGNKKPDIAVFYNYFGTLPETRQAIFLFESDGASFSLLPVAYEATRASFDFSSTKFAIPGDYNLDGCSDIAVLLEDPGDQNLIIPVFEGSVAGQLFPIDYTSFTGSEPYLPAVVHAAGGQFAGDTATDLVLFYDNPGSGMQEILMLESESNTFKVPETVFSADPANLSITDITSVRSGDFLFRPLVSVTTWKDNRKGAVSFTFDDGYRGAFDYGGAALEAAGLRGTFYIFTDTGAVYYGAPAGTELIRAYKNMGHEIASHTINHSDLGMLTESGDADSLQYVLSASAELLNERFDQYTTSMSIPFGSFRYETLAYISRYFHSARSSQYGFNLATPYDFYALRSWPVLSTTSPAYVDNLLDIAESYGTYLPLMYHDILDGPFNEDSLIYTYSRDLFSETVQDALNRDLWIDTHREVYKYIRERNALRIQIVDSSGLDALQGSFTFEADDALADSLFNVELTLRISLPDGWMADTLSIGTAGDFEYREVQQDAAGSYTLFDWLPVSGLTVTVHEGKLTGTGFMNHPATASEITLTAAPNPFTHETTITYAGELNISGPLIVRDIHGRVVQEITAYAERTYRLLREDLPAGFYIIQLYQSGIPIAALKLMAL